MSVRTTNLATHGLLKMNLTLGFHINHIHNLGMWLHQFCLGKHNSAARKVLKAYSDQNQVIAGINGAHHYGRCGLLDGSGWGLPTSNCGNVADHSHMPASGLGHTSGKGPPRFLGNGHSRSVPDGS